MTAICSACENSIDYSTVSVGGYVLPYTVELDAASSNLSPVPGELQRFCYRITAVTVSGQTQALQRFVLGLNAGVTRNDFCNLTVSINDTPQTVTWGENARVIASGSPDPATGCAGLALDFTLNTTDDEMLVCFSLLRAFGVGPSRVCLNGGNATVSSLSICGPALAPVNSCPVTSYQEMDLCVPITITPNVTVGEMVVSCCGDPVVTAGTNVCPGTLNGTCSYTVAQRLCVGVPVEFGAQATAGDYAVTCRVSNATGCPSCPPNASEPIPLPSSNTTAATTAAATCGCQASPADTTLTRQLPCGTTAEQPVSPTPTPLQTAAAAVATVTHRAPTMGSARPIPAVLLNEPTQNGFNFQNALRTATPITRDLRTLSGRK